MIRSRSSSAALRLKVSTRTARGRAPALDPVDDRLDQRRGLAGAGAGEHQQRAAGVVDHGLLVGVELGGATGAVPRAVRAGTSSRPHHIIRGRQEPSTARDGRRSAAPGRGPPLQPPLEPTGQLRQHDVGHHRGHHTVVTSTRGTSGSPGAARESSRPASRLSGKNAARSSPPASSAAARAAAGRGPPRRAPAAGRTSPRCRCAAPSARLPTMPWADSSHQAPLRGRLPGAPATPARRSGRACATRPRHARAHPAGAEEAGEALGERRPGPHPGHHLVDAVGGHVPGDRDRDGSARQHRRRSQARRQAAGRSRRRVVSEVTATTRPGPCPPARAAERRALLEVVHPRLLVVARRQRPVGADHAPPRHRAAVRRHHPATLRGPR